MYVDCYFVEILLHIFVKWYRFRVESDGGFAVYTLFRAGSSQVWLDSYPSKRFLPYSTAALLISSTDIPAHKFFLRHSV